MTFGSLDNVEDACELLDGTEFPYLLIVAQSPDATRFYSNLGDNAAALKTNVESGEFVEQILDHLEQFYEI